MSFKHILVTGGAGFIGSALVRRLVSAGHNVRVLDDLSRGTPRRLADISESVDLRSADVRDPVAVRKACDDIDLVWHLASINGTEFFYSRPELVLDVGVRGILNVLDGVSSAGVSDLIVMSSSEVYQTPPNVPTDERAPLSIPDPLNPRYSYAGAKIISELLALNFSRGAITRVVVARPHNVYGPDMGWEHVIPQLVVRAARLATRSGGDVRLPIQGSGAETRAFAYIEDVVDALMILMVRGEHRTIYHVGNDEEVSIASLVRHIGQAIGRQIDLVPGEAAAGGTLRRCPDITRLRALGYKPHIQLDAGLPPTVAWYLSHIDDVPGEVARA